ncbi:MAG: GNAT family N-acetyltransferase [Parvibaculaceae bacterium]|nr:GNAT family N-acetyltransferase [Parvibaculaceae bacterium]
MTVLLTERLQLRPYKQDEAHLLHSIIGDLRIVFWRNEPGSLEEAQQWLEKTSRIREETGMGVWGVFDRKTDDFLGQTILQPLPETGEPEIGYHFRVEAQGHGYATEAAKCLLHHGFAGLELPRIVAVVLPDNHPSQTVMKKLGLPYIRDLMKSDMLHNYFALERPAYLARWKQDQQQPA